MHLMCAISLSNGEVRCTFMVGAIKILLPSLKSESHGERIKCLFSDNTV